MKSWTRRAAVATLLTGICTTALLSGTGIAAAADADSLTRSTCSWGQINAAFNNQDPVLASRIDGHPELTTGLAAMYQMAPPTRPESFMSIVSQYPDVLARMDQIRRDNPPGSDPVLAKFDRVADTCHGY